MQIDYDRIKYATHRALENEKKEPKGELKMFSYDLKKFYYIMRCPYCNTEQEGEVFFEKRPYRVSCKKCQKKFIVARMLQK
jgi:ribosomal protein S27E